MIFKSIVCDNCNNIISTIDDIYCRKYASIDGERFCEYCVENFKKKLTENLENELCCECKKKLIDGEEMFEEAEYYYKINGNFYCVDCIDENTWKTENIDKSEFEDEPDYEED